MKRNGQHFVRDLQSQNESVNTGFKLIYWVKTRVRNRLKDSKTTHNSLVNRKKNKPREIDIEWKDRHRVFMQWS